MEARSGQLINTKRTAVIFLLLLTGVMLTLLVFRSLAVAAENGPLVTESTRVQESGAVSVLYLAPLTIACWAATH